MLIFRFVLCPSIKLILERGFNKTKRERRSAITVYMRREFFSLNKSTIMHCEIYSMLVIMLEKPYTCYTIGKTRKLCYTQQTYGNSGYYALLAVRGVLSVMWVLFIKECISNMCPHIARCIRKAQITLEIIENNALCI